MRSLQKFAAVHSSVHNHFNHERHLYSRVNFKLIAPTPLTSGVSSARHEIRRIGAN